MKGSPVELYRQEIFPRLSAENVYAEVQFKSKSSRQWRGPCPLHGGDNPMAFCVNPETLRWHCFTGCARGGDVLAFLNGGDSPQGKQFVQMVEKAAALIGLRAPSSQLAARGPSDVPNPARPPQPLEELMQTFQRRLKGSRGETYLRSRGIPLDVAINQGVGYAPPGDWPHQSRDWKFGRVVFPHTTPAGEMINLYGRAVGIAHEVPATLRHAHLPGSKGYFGTWNLSPGEGPVWVAEGVFDALSLTLAGCPRVVAIFGVGGWRWDWVKDVNQIVFAFDGDQAGQQTLRRMAIEGTLRGKSIGTLNPKTLGQHKDLNEAWCAGNLRSLLEPASRD